MYLKQGKAKVHFETDERPMMDFLFPKKSNLLLFHHRIPTSTSNVLSACHPFGVHIGNRLFYTVHNGMLYNDDKLYAEHKARGIKYRSLQPDGISFNDSEALAFDVAEYLAGKSKELKASGSIAFITVELDKKDKRPAKVYFGHNYGSPLLATMSEKGISLASELTDGEEVKTQTLYSYDLKTGELTETPCIIPSGYAGYPSHIGSKAPVAPVWQDYHDYGNDDYASWQDRHYGAWSPVKQVADTLMGERLDQKVSSKESEGSAIYLGVLESEIGEVDALIQELEAGMTATELRTHLANWSQRYMQLDAELEVPWPDVVSHKIGELITAVDEFIEIGTAALEEGDETGILVPDRKLIPSTLS